ncbi:MAG: hypothetical protein ACM30H_07260 [Clostridia bacterium]
MIARLAALALAAALAGCAAPRPGVDADLGSQAPQVSECARWYRVLDDAVDAARVRDAQYTRIEGFPYLRVDRLLAALAPRARSSAAAFDAYAERLLARDLESRAHEIANLPREAIPAVSGAAEDERRAAAFARTQSCGRLLRELDLAKPGTREALLAKAQVPDDYSDVARAVGLYPLSRVVFARGVRRWEDEAKASFAAPAPQAGVVRYAPENSSPPLKRAAAAALIGRAELDPLGVPVLSERELAQFAAAYAPSVEIAIAGDADRFGALRWTRTQDAPVVDAAEPVAYVQQAHVRYGDRILLQLVYTLWFPERPPGHEGDLLAGRLDGLVWRVTVAPDGEPLLYDSIHPCGCYHEFFPTPRARPLPAPDPLEEWAFSPLALPRVAEGERPVLRLASGTHYLQAVAITRDAESVVRYGLRDYDELRSLPRPDGSRRSVFGPDGLIAGSERGERFLFWPMGIRSAGAMRQSGRQATAFVGRRHFDDADLLEKRFVLDLAGHSP